VTALLVAFAERTGGGLTPYSNRWRGIDLFHLSACNRYRTHTGLVWEFDIDDEIAIMAQYAGAAIYRVDKSMTQTLRCRV